MSDVVVVSAVRTAVGTPAGALAPLGAGGLGEVAVRAAIARAGLGAAMVDAVIWADEVGVPNGAALPGGGLRSVMRAADRLAAGDGEVLVAAARGGRPTTDVDGMTEALAAVEAIAGRSDLTRVELESFALTSRLRAAAAARAGRFADEIAPVKPGTGAQDETIGPPMDGETLPDPQPAAPGAAKATAEALAPAGFGGAALVLTRADIAWRRGLPILARLVTTATARAATPDAAIAGAARTAAADARWGLNDIDLVEVDEASAAHALSAWRDLGLDLGRVNVLGGALGLGAPSGASDLRMVVTLLHELRRRALRSGLACADDGGLGRAICVERF